MNNRTLTIVISFALALAANAQVTDYKATVYCDGSVEKEQYRSHNVVENIASNSNVLHACNGVSLYMSGYRMNKTAGATVDSDYRRSGINSVMTATTGSNVQLEDCEINSHIDKCDGLTVIGSGTSGKVNKGVFKLYRSNSAGMSAIDGGSISISMTEFSVMGSLNTPFYTENGSIDADNVKGTTSGISSPLFRTAGTQTASKCEMTANKSNIAYVNAGGNLILTENRLNCNGYCGFQMYSSGKERGNSRLELAKNRLSISDGPLIMACNTNAEVLFRSGNSVNINCKDLLIAKADEWGVKGSNGADVTITSEKQNMKGNITVDSISSVKMNLIGATYSGAINSDANPCAVIRLVLDRNSVWNVVNDSYITSIQFEGPLDKALLKQIKGKSTVYYNADDPENAALGGMEHAIAGGGRLIPNK